MTASVQISKSLREWVETTTHRAMRDQSRYVKSLGFSMPQFFLLMHVYYKKQCGISDLSEHMEITTAAASQTVEKLVQSGVLERAEDPSDRRAKQITLSTKGRELIEKSIGERFRWVDDLTADLTAVERKKIAEALEILTAKVKETNQ
jgi:MarR family transcriptional regulator, organic hydroperoxide resistance regulator